jgi:Domain of unknown function (DUF4388)
MNASVALHGNLRDFGIGEVFQLIGQQQKTGTLEVSDEEVRLRVAFDGGAVVYGERVGAYEQAALGDMLVRTGLVTPQRLVSLERQIAERGAQLESLLRQGGELATKQLDEILSLVTRETLFELLRWTRGSFHFTAGPVPHDRDASHCIPAEQLLMDGLRMVDEWRSFDEAAVDPDAVFRPAGRFEEFRRTEPGESPDRLAVAERLFLLIDGRQPVRRVVDLSRLGTFEGARWLTRFRRAGLVDRVDPQLVAKKRRRPALELSHGPSLSSLVAAVLPWLLLAAVVVTGSQRSAPRPAGAERLAQQAFLHAAESSFETLRLRNLSDAYRYARGEWPGGMTDLRRFFHDARRTQPLAPLDPREYYFAQRGDTFLVLAPED